MRNVKSNKTILFFKCSFFFLLSLQTLKSYSQDCPDSDFPPFYQCWDIAGFVAEYPNCSCLPSTLLLPQWGVESLSDYPALAQLDSISGNLSCNECSVNSLEGLESITYVGGSVIIDEPHGTLLDLNGLNNLSYVGLNFKLSECSDLESTSGLDNLLHIGNNIWFDDNSELIEIIGFENIHHLPGQLYFNEQDAMIDMNGFENLISIGNNLRIWDNAKLKSLDGIDHVELISGDLEIDNNDSLVQVDALNQLNTLGENLILSKNSMLDNIGGLTSIVNFNGEIIIYENALITSLNGIENIQADSIMNLVLLDCNSLSICSQPNICQYLVNSMGPSTISSNYNGCNSASEISQVCAGIGVDEINSELLFNVFPNPIGDESIFISKFLKPGMELHFYNCLGSRVKIIKSSGSNQLLIDRKGLTQGIYQIRMVHDNEVIDTIKILVR